MNEQERQALQRLLVQREAMRDFAADMKQQNFVEPYATGYWHAMYEATDVVVRQLADILKVEDFAAPLPALRLAKAKDEQETPYHIHLPPLPSDEIAKMIRQRWLDSLPSATVPWAKPPMVSVGGHRLPWEARGNYYLDADKRFIGSCDSPEAAAAIVDYINLLTEA